MRQPRHWHRWLGLALLAPLVVWIATGAVFLLRPGYEAAYADLSVQRYPLGRGGPAARDGWHEVRRVRTVLGPHLLVRGGDGDWRQLEPGTLESRPLPNGDAVRRLVADAIAGRARYGAIERVDGATVHTTTGVTIEVDWPRLTLDQRGRDTRWISWAYDVHALEWTGIGWLDKALGTLGLALLTLAAGLGAWLFFRPNAGTRASRRDPE